MFKNPRKTILGLVLLFTYVAYANSSEPETIAP